MPCPPAPNAESCFSEAVWRVARRVTTGTFYVIQRSLYRASRKTQVQIDQKWKWNRTGHANAMAPDEILSLWKQQLKIYKAHTPTHLPTCGAVEMGHWSAFGWDLFPSLAPFQECSKYPEGRGRAQWYCSWGPVNLQDLIFLKNLMVRLLLRTDRLGLLAPACAHLFTFQTVRCTFSWCPVGDRAVGVVAYQQAFFNPGLGRGG